MSSNSVLAYLDSIRAHSAETDDDFACDLLSDEQDHLKRILSIIKKKASDENNINESATFFRPFIVHQPQLIRLFNTLRCQIKENLASEQRDDPKIKKDTENAIKTALIVDSLLEVITLDGMSIVHPWQREAQRFGFDGCDLIRNDHFVVPAVEALSYTYGHQLRHKFGLIQHDGAFYTIEKSDDGACKVAAASVAQAQTQAYAALKAACESFEADHQRPANATELANIRVLTNRQDIGSCRLVHLDMSQTTEEEVLKGPYDYVEKSGLIFWKNRFFSVEKTNKKEDHDDYVEDTQRLNFEIKEIITDENKLHKYFNTLDEGQIKQATVAECAWIHALFGHQRLESRRQELLNLLSIHCNIDLDSHQYFKQYQFKPDTYYVSWLSGYIQFIFDGYNQIRLGSLRVRRLLFAIGLFLTEEQYALGDTWTGHLRWAENHGVLLIFSTLAWLFFLPRLLRNVVILIHHTFNDAGVSKIEAALDRSTRFQVHLMRIWPELVNDFYWFVSGCLFYTLYYGVVSSTTISISLITQMADLFFAIIRAWVEIRRLNVLETKMIELKAPYTLETNLRASIIFEEQVLMYMILHFLVLLVALCLSLPSMLAISPALPVVGGVCSVIMTVISWNVSRARPRAREQFDPLHLDSADTPKNTIKPSVTSRAF